MRINCPVNSLSKPSIHRAEDSKLEKERDSSSLRTLAIISLLAVGTLSLIARTFKGLTPEEPIPPIQCDIQPDIQYYIEKAKSKDSEAAYCLAQMYFQGKNGAKKSPLDAIHLLKHAACESKQAATELKQLKNRVCQQLFTDTLDPNDHLLALDLCEPENLSSLLCICPPYPIYSEPNGLEHPELVKETLDLYKEFWKSNLIEKTEDSCDFNRSDEWEVKSHWPNRVQDMHEICERYSCFNPKFSS